MSKWLNIPLNLGSHVITLRPSITVCEISLVFYLRCYLDICISLKHRAVFIIYTVAGAEVLLELFYGKAPCGGALTHSIPRRTGLYSLMSYADRDDQDVHLY